MDVIAPPLPDNESARLAVLRRYRILDTVPAEPFDRITRLACRLFKVPIALISLTDQRRQWFKSRCGLDVEEIDRDVAFCAHALLSRAVMIVQDARQDARFAANPLVTGPPHVRFYAGAPLIDAAGFALGTLCLFDSRPRGLSKPGVDTLRDLAGIVIEQIERSAAGSGIIAGGPSEPMAGGQAAQERMERQELFLNSVLENLSEGVVACDETGRLILFNRSTRQFHGVDDAPVPPSSGRSDTAFTAPTARR